MGSTTIVFHVTSDGDALILNENSTILFFHGKIANHDGKGYLLTINLYKGKNDAATLVPNKRNMEEKAAVQIGGMTVNKQEQTTTKQLA